MIAISHSSAEPLRGLVADRLDLRGAGPHGLRRLPGAGRDAPAGLPVDEQRQADAAVDAQEFGHDLVTDVGDAGVDGLDVCLDRG